MEWIKIEEAGGFAVLFVVGFLVSIFRVYSADRVANLRIGITSSALVGFYAVAVISIWIDLFGGGKFGFKPSYIAFAIVIGLAGPVNQKLVQGLVRHLFYKVIKGLGGDPDKLLEEADETDG